MNDRSGDTKSMALFCDFENVALGVREARYHQFDISKVLERLLLKGSIVVKKAYCDWERYREFKASMHQASFELIEIPHLRMSGKNSADIRMVVDALDLCYTKSHVDTFVIISGDSDFSPLVSKLRENAKTVIGVGVKNSTSELLINNCDEFIYYDDLVRNARAPRRRSSGNQGTGRAPAQSAPAISVATAPVGLPEAAAPAPLSAIEPALAPAAAPGRTRRGGRKSASPPPALEVAVQPAAQLPVSEAPTIPVSPQGSPTPVESAPQADEAAMAAPDAKPGPRRRRGTAKAATVAASAAEAASPAASAGVAPARRRKAGSAGGEASQASAAVPTLPLPAVPTTPLAAVPTPADAFPATTAEAGVTGAAVGGTVEPTAQEFEEPADRDHRQDDRMQQALDLVVNTIEALAAERGGGEKIWGSMVKQTLKRRRPGFNEAYFGFRSFNRLLEEARDRGLIELDLDDKSGGYTVRSLV